MFVIISIKIASKTSFLCDVLALFGSVSLEIMAVHQQWIIHLMNSKHLFNDVSPMNSFFRFTITTFLSFIISIAIRYSIRPWKNGGGIMEGNSAD